ncbi:MAG: AAA family ATPase [Kiritimatiellae bacterium]|nr:AAA family ATPase [Kiritimatiellia bacterium]
MMKLTLKNVARISIAEIDIGGITVIAGPNGAGKSTISRAAMTLCSVSNRLPYLVQAERISSIFSVLRENFGKLGGDIFSFEAFPNERSKSWRVWLSPEWWKKLDGIREWFRDNAKRQSGFVVYPDNFLDSPKFSEALREAMPKVREILERDESAYVNHVCEKAFRRAFRGQMRPLHQDAPASSSISIADEKSEVSISFNSDEICGMTEMGRTIVPTTVYIEPLHFVDFVDVRHYNISDRYTAGSLCVCNAISRPPPKSLSLEEEEELKETRAILKDIVRVIHGRLVDDDDTIRFKETIVDADYMIDLKNMASGMKTMAAVVRAVENRSVRRGSLLIIDEPESNLHPEWQVKFAIFLVLLQKRLGISILLNTHSPYFLQAVNVYAKDSQIECHFYNMVPDLEEVQMEIKTESAPRFYHADPVSGNLESVFRDMSRPFDNLI